MNNPETINNIVESIKSNTDVIHIYNTINLNLKENNINESVYYQLLNMFFSKNHIYSIQAHNILCVFLKSRFNIDELTDDILINNLSKTNSYIEFMLIIFYLIKPQILCNHKEDIIKHNNRVHNNLDKLLHFCQTTPQYIFKNVDNFRKILILNYNYYHVYNGLNNKDLYIKISKLWKILCPDLIYNFNYKKSSDKIKIGFASSFILLNQSVCRDRIGIIRSLINDPNYEVFIFTNNSKEESIFDVAINTIGFKNKIVIPDSLEETRKIISNYNLDILVYPEIGMDIFFYLLAFSRLAHVQINTWGHSETSGIDTIDYYFSSKYYEYEGSEKNYSEKLICLDSMCTHYYSLRIFDFYPHICNMSKESIRIEYNLPKICNIYGIFQTVFKYHPDTITMIKNILYTDPKAIIIMLNYSELEERFIDYLDYNLAYHSNRVRLMGRKSLQEYCKIIKCVDIVLDAYPFGGCNSSLEAFNLGKVVITIPSDKINGRFTYGFYQKMGISEPICLNLKEFVDKAVFYANNKLELIKVENKILENSGKLFEEEESIITWKNKLVELYCK